MTDRLNIDLSNIDKNSLLFKKFMNKKQNNGNSSSISISVTEATPATKDFTNNNSAYANQKSIMRDVNTQNNFKAQLKSQQIQHKEFIKEQANKNYQLTNQSNFIKNFKLQEIQRKKVRSSYQKYQPIEAYKSGLQLQRQQNDIKQSIGSPGSINIISPRSRKNRNQKYQHEHNSMIKNDYIVPISEINQMSPQYNVKKISYETKHVQYNQKEPIVQYQRGILTKKWDQIENNTKMQHSQPQNQQKKWQVYEPEDYKKKYQLLHKQYEELQKSMLEQNKMRKREVLQASEKVEQMSQRMFQIQSYNDQLIMQNRKLKQKSEYQSKLRVKAEEESKENEYKIQQLSDMIQGKQQNLKKKVDQVVHWTNQIQTLKQENHRIALANQQLQQYCRQMQSASHGIQKQKNNKEYMVEDLRAKISSLVQQNGYLKDQIYNITTKLYHLQTQNQTLKSDIVRIREKQRFPISYLNEQMQRSSMQPSQNQSTSNLTPHRNLSRNFDLQKRQQSNQIVQQSQRPRQRRRGQFAKQRQVKPQKQQIPQNQQNNNSFVSRRQQNIPEKGFKDYPIHLDANNNNNGSKMVRLRELNQQLDKIKDMKAMNGKLRKRKIDLEREIMQLQGVSFN